MLAVLLWFNVTAGERRDEQVRTRLEFEVADSMWVPIQLPAEVTTIFQGRRSDVQRLFLETPRIRYVGDRTSCAARVWRNSRRSSRRRPLPAT